MASSKPGRIARYATSTKNITGCVLAIGGPALALTGVIAPPIGLALAPALYAIGALAAPARKPVNLVAGLDASDVARSLDEIERRIAGHVPTDIVDAVSRISRTIRDTLPRAHALGAGSPGQFVLVQCATDYLPAALQSYLDLPRAYADHHIVSDGKTARQLLVDQLALLSKQIDEVADAVNRADTDRLLANGRFLAEKFGKSPLDIDGIVRSAPTATSDPSPAPADPSPTTEVSDPPAPPTTLAPGATGTDYKLPQVPVPPPPPLPPPLDVPPHNPPPTAMPPHGESGRGSA